jgi:hypothetical protein
VRDEPPLVVLGRVSSYLCLQVSERRCREVVRSPRRVDEPGASTVKFHEALAERELKGELCLVVRR